MTNQQQTQEKQFKYVLDGVGFNTKREYMNAVAISCLSDDGKNKMIVCIHTSMKKVKEVFKVDDVQAAKMQYIGFRNTQQKTLNQNLQNTADSLTEKGHVELVIFNFVEGGRPMSNATAILLRKDFNEKGLQIIGDKLSDEPYESEKSKPTPKEAINNYAEALQTIHPIDGQSNETTEFDPSLLISEDITRED